MSPSLFLTYSFFFPNFLLKDTIKRKKTTEAHPLPTTIIKTENRVSPYGVI